MAESVPCLVRIGQCVKQWTILKLKTDQVTIGRSRQATYTLPSQGISRWHAIISHLQGSRWSLMDTNSLNGICVNGHPLNPFTPYKLHDGDLIQFGVLNCNRPEHQYRFHTSWHVIGNNDRKRGLLKRAGSEILIEGTAERLHATQEHTDVLASIFNFTEKKLQCNICGKLIVQATVLNCSHMFCKLCIINWMQNNDSCPTCQQFIISVVHVAALDSCLDKIAKQLGQRDKQQRAVVIPMHNAKKKRSCVTDNNHPPRLRIDRNNRLAVTETLVRAAARLESLKLAGVSTERITFTKSVDNTQTPFVKGATKGIRLPACLKRRPGKHSPLAAKIEHGASRIALFKEKVLNKCTVLKRTAALKKVQRIARKAITANRANTDGQAIVTTADALLTRKRTAAVEPVDGSMTDHHCKVIRNSRKTVTGHTEIANNVAPINVTGNENMESDSAEMKNDSVGEIQ